MDQSHLELAGDIGGGEYGNDAGNGFGRFGIDLDDIGAGVIGQAQGTVQQAVDREVVDESAVARERAFGALVFGAFLADPPGRAGSGIGDPEASNSMASMILT